MRCLPRLLVMASAVCMCLSGCNGHRLPWAVGVEASSDDAAVDTADVTTVEEAVVPVEQLQRLELPEKTLDGGMYASPLLGRGDCADRLFAHVCRNGASSSVGELVALSTADGSILYSVPYGQFAWSSPVGFLNERDEQFLFTDDASGMVRIIRGRTGEVLCRTVVGYNFESSPVVVGNAAVVGTRGKNIYKFVIK